MLGAFKQPSKQFGCSQTCGRMEVTAAAPAWFMETMPVRRCMGDMVLLPPRDVLIINGAQNGSQGWGFATNPAFNPVVYRPGFSLETRFLIQPAGTIPRMYHSTANLLPDGRVLLAGSNTHQFYTFTGTPFPTELRLEAWSPPYLDSVWNPRRPTVISSPTQLSYGQVFNVSFSITNVPRSFEINLCHPPFTTHSFSQGQRLLRLKVSPPIATGINWIITATAPPNGNVAPPGYYMLFPVMSGIPGISTWVQITP